MKPNAHMKCLFRGDSEKDISSSADITRLSRDRVERQEMDMQPISCIQAAVEYRCETATLSGMVKMTR